MRVVRDGYESMLLGNSTGPVKTEPVVLSPKTNSTQEKKII